MLTPESGECHLWLVAVRPPERWLGLLDGEERARLRRLGTSRARDVLLTSRATQRLVGARYLGVPPWEVTIDRRCGHCGGREHGRPRFPDAVIEYSVSRTEHWVIMAVVGGDPVGVDIEDPAALRDPAALVRAALTRQEQDHLAALPAAARTSWLLAAWTRKEAAMKLAGLGLQAPPNRLDVRAATVAATGIARWPAGTVHLRGLAVPDGHTAALATATPVRSVRRCSLRGSDGYEPTLAQLTAQGLNC